MNIGIYGKKFSLDVTSYIQLLISNLELRNCKLYIYKPYYDIIKKSISFNRRFEIFTKEDTLKGTIDYLFSVGGDGTLLDSVTIIQDTGIPIIGINTGRLGFLSSIAKENVVSAINDLVQHNYSIDKRTLVRVETPSSEFKQLNYALNEVSITKKDTASMITVHAYVNDVYLNTYWADGLIIATPTGSTGYSLSCGGPIVTPDSENFIITPIATHNLTVRPIVMPDKNSITLKVGGRDQNYFIGLDSRVTPMNKTLEINIRKESFKVNLIKLHDEDFFNTIRNKLMWGKDKRN